MDCRRDSCSLLQLLVTAASTMQPAVLLFQFHNMLIASIVLHYSIHFTSPSCCELFNVNALGASYVPLDIELPQEPHTNHRHLHCKRVSQIDAQLFFCLFIVIMGDDLVLLFSPSQNHKLVRQL